jgi:hypothetical protein
VSKQDAETFPQTGEGKRRAEFRSESLADSADPDANGFKVQDSAEFKRLAPGFTRIPLERIGLETRGSKGGER